MSKQTVKQEKKVKVAKVMDAKPENRRNSDRRIKDVGWQMDRYEKIAREAYLLAEQRSFQDGDTVADWLQAEAMVDSGVNVSH